MEGRHFQEIRKRLSVLLNDDEIESLPRAYELVGDIALINIPEILVSKKSQVARTYRDVLGVRSVMEKKGISGEFREPGHTLLSGTDTVTVHKENGIRYKIDLKMLMFSAGNINERIRMSRLRDVGLVVDMFAGIGYFSLPIAKYTGSRVMALEKNPASYEYLVQNIKMNRLEGNMNALNIDCRDYVGESAKRIIMGYVRTTDEYLQKAFSIADDGCIVHYHQTAPSADYEGTIRREIREQSSRSGAEVEFIGSRIVKKYSPGIVHAVMDFVIKKY